MKQFFFQQFGLSSLLLLLFCATLPAQESFGVTFRRDHSNFSNQHDPCQVFIGVGTSAVSGGLQVDYTVDGTPARTAGVLAGDVLLALDGVPVRSQSELIRERDKHRQGDAFSMKILRDGREMTVNARFKACSPEELEISRQNREMEEIRMEEMAERMAEKYLRAQRVERDPCKVFIGVYSSGYAIDGRGTRVTGVIDDTPAKQSGIQPGDVILAFNNQPINTHNDLLLERNKYQPGDAFRLTVVRNGATLNIDARFKSCATPDAAPVQNNKEVPAGTESRNEPAGADNLLSLEVLEAYPNPTYGPLNIRFEAEAVPTTVRILDVSGKAVYTKDLPRFGGSFSEQINLFSQKPGNYVLSIQQGDNIRTRQIVLLPGA
ncbi:MAG: PDZ domain-containing protein [Lewinellaceae bacterium]|nr:PDZ domain-containing protein [Lewinellaceae bacterium]